MRVALRSWASVDFFWLRVILASGCITVMQCQAVCRFFFQGFARSYWVQVQNGPKSAENSLIMALLCFNGKANITVDSCLAKWECWASGPAKLNGHRVQK